MSSSDKQVSRDREPRPPKQTKASAATSNLPQSGTSRDTAKAGSSKPPSAVRTTFSTLNPGQKSFAPSSSASKAAKTEQDDPTDTSVSAAKSTPKRESGRRNAFSGPSGEEARRDTRGQVDPAKVTEEAVEFVDVPLRDAEDEKKEREREEDESWEKLDKPSWLK